MISMTYVPFRITTIDPSRQINFDIWIHYRNRYLRYIKAGSFIKTSLQKKLRRQRITKFYLVDRDEPYYQEYMDKILNDSLSDRKTLIKNVPIIEGSVHGDVEGVIESPNSEVAYNRVVQKSSYLRQVIDYGPTIIKTFYANNPEKGEQILKHSLNVSLLSIKMAQQHNLGEKTQDELATAGLLHDIGYSFLTSADKLIYLTPPENVSEQDQMKVLGHVELGAKMLVGKPFVSQRIVDLIRNHECDCSQKDALDKKSRTTHRIIASADYFDRNVSLYNRDPLKVIESMDDRLMGSNTSKIVGGLRHIIRENQLDLVYKDRNNIPYKKRLF